jgi:GTPase SAR1 family protein
MSNNYIPNNEHFLKRARNIRNELLNRTDRYFLIDYPIAYEQQMIIKAYRQELREFINDNKERILNGEKVDLPEQPNFIDLNIIY